jgi:AI-2 transport protein TqsA
VSVDRSSGVVRTAQIFTGVAAVLAVLHYLSDVLIPFIMAFVLAVIVDALVTAIRRRWPVAPRWIVSAVAGLSVIIAAVGGILVLAQGAGEIISQGPALLDRLEMVAQSAGRSIHLSRPLQLNSIDPGRIAAFALSGAQSVGSALLLTAIYFGFMLFGRQRIDAKFDAVGEGLNVPQPLRAVIQRIAADIRGYLWVQTIAASLTTAAAAIVMAAVGLHNVLFWSVIFFLLHFIPQIGTAVGSIAPSLFALVQFPSTWQAVTIFGLIQFFAFLVGNFVYPRLQAQAQNIDPISTLLALSLWTVLWGLRGAFLAVPLTLILMMIFAHFESTRWVAALLSNDGRPSSLTVKEATGVNARCRLGAEK